MTKRERASIKRRRPLPKDRCVVTTPQIGITVKSDLSLRLYASARLLRALANNLDCIADQHL